MDFRRRSAFWAEERNSCSVKRQRGICVPVKNWSETSFSAAEEGSAPRVVA